VRKILTAKVIKGKLHHQWRAIWWETGIRAGSPYTALAKVPTRVVGVRFQIFSGGHVFGFRLPTLSRFANAAPHILDNDVANL
jgi:hypothetical protein